MWNNERAKGGSLSKQRGWKGPVTAEFEMPGLEGDACFTFYPATSRIGK